MEPHNYLVGDILADDHLGSYPASFFRISRLIGKRGLELEVLNTKVRERTVVAGSATPGAKDKALSPIKAKVKKNGAVQHCFLVLSPAYARKWSGKPVKYDGPGDCC